MGKKARLTAFVFASFVLVGLAVGGYWLVRKTEPESCSICQREIHPQSRAVIEANGKREATCCARCALTFAKQAHTSIRLVQVTDYNTLKPLAPDQAYFVEGSRLVLCESHKPMLDQTRHPFIRVFDRCEPSLYAFARREDAEAFARDNDGTVVRLADVMKRVETRP
jgi:hypothetical protein